MTGRLSGRCFGLFAFVFLFAWPAAASSQVSDRWRAMVRGVGYSIWVDTTTVQPANDALFPIVWSRWNLGLDRPLNDDSGKTYDYSMVRVEVDCDQQRMRTWEAHYYDSDGTVVYSSPRAGPWASQIPDSVGEQFVRGACAYLIERFGGGELADNSIY